jgi:hypothetical protein
MPLRSPALPNLSRCSLLAGCSKRASFSRQDVPSHGKTARSAKNNERHVCGRHRDGEAAVSREDALVDFFNILSRKKQV